MEFTTTADVTNQGLFLLIHGRSGAGKTSMVKTIPNFEQDVLYIGIEGGDLPLRRSKIAKIEISKYRDINRVIEYLQEETRFKWVIIDSLTELAEKCLEDQSYKGGQDIKPGWDEYYWFNTIMKKVVKSLRDLHGLHVVLTCLSAMDTEDNRGKLTPVIPARKLRSELPQFFDEVLYLHVKDDGARELITDCSPYVEAKDRSGALDNPEKPDLGVIVSKIYGDKAPERKATPNPAKGELRERITKGEDTVAKLAGTSKEAVRKEYWEFETAFDDATMEEFNAYLFKLLAAHKKLKGGKRDGNDAT